ncbi:MAG: prolipoprotein diacylglyceryl transferase [Planctomycetota bacterium]|jgi:phosphatidylglycerol:prolipoprotein diacylglycerol transferase
MYPELFKIPFINWPLPTYGLMMVIGFLSAIFLIRHLSRNITPDPHLITNAALYSLIAGVIGARLFYVLHYPDKFQGNWLSIFAIWQGGLELLGGVILAIPVIVFYIWYHKVSIRHHLDILAIGLMLALVFGRIGCFMKGDCFGKPTNLPWAVRFPYNSDPYRSQVYSNLQRDRPDPHLQLSGEFFGYYNINGKAYYGLKPYEDLREEQKKKLKETDRYRCLPVHPTQLYSSINAAFLCLILYLFWRRAHNAELSGSSKKLFTKPGQIFSLKFILYGIARFFIEFLRDDNPFEHAWWAIYKGGTVSQNLGIYMAVLGVVLIVIFERMKPDRITLHDSKQVKVLA